MPTILILDGHCAAALALTRSLGRAGNRIAVGANRGMFAAATLSRYCNLRFEYPIPTDDADAFTALVADFARRHKVDMIIPVTDWTTYPISRYRDRFDRSCRLSLPSAQALETVSDKYATIELARSLGIPVPLTWLVRCAQDLGALPDLPFPIVVKDRFSARWFGNRAVFGSVAYAYTPTELRCLVTDRVAQAGDVLVQSFVAGMGIGFASFASNGDVCLPFQWRRIREVDPRGSGSSSSKSVPVDQRIRQFSTSLLQRSCFEGVAMVEYKQEAQSGRPILMEVNGRPWGSLQLAIYSGVNYPLHLARWRLEGITPPREIAYKQGITCRRVVAELTHLDQLRHGKPDKWPGSYPTLWTTLPRIAVPWYPGMRYDDLLLSDIRPGLAGIANWFRKRLGRNKSSGRTEKQVVTPLAVEQSAAKIVGFSRTGRVQLLDLGCGSGRDLTSWGVTASDKVMGIDIDGRRLAAARVRFPNRTYLQGAGECLPFVDESFDRVISGVALPYMNIQKTLTEIHRILVPGGRLSLSLHLPNFTIAELLHNAIPRPVPTLFRLYVLANGSLLHCTGKTLGSLKGRTESFQTERGMKLALNRTGFINFSFSRGTGQTTETFIVEARKSKVMRPLAAAHAA